MRIIADLQLHSKYSRAVSPQMILPEIAKWAMIKRIDLMATGDWTHPLWFREITAHLEEKSAGLFALKKPVEAADGISVQAKQPLFLLSGEISSIYSQGGKVRRIHNLVFAPSLATVEKINKELVKRGANLMSDGRPITGLTSMEIAEVVFSIDEKCLLIPAHCLLPDTLIHTNPLVKKINQIRKGDEVLTHKGRYKEIKNVYKRPYKGKIYTIRPWYFSLGLTTTSEHPYLGIKTIKKCRSDGGICRPFGKHKDNCLVRSYTQYKPAWIPASKLEMGDILIFPRGLVGQEKNINSIRISDYVKEFSVNNGYISPKGTNKKVLSDKIEISPSFCRLVGYYLAEGSTDNRDSISFCFHSDETDYIKDVKNLIKEIIGINYCREYQRKKCHSIELTFYSKILSKFFVNFFYQNSGRRNATTKSLAPLFLKLPPLLQSEIIKGWWRGDGGYTSSRFLMNQMKQIFLRLGIIPSILMDSVSRHEDRGKHNFNGRIVKANADNFFFSNLAFFEDKNNLLKEKEFKKFNTKIGRRHGFIDEHYVYLPIRKIEKNYYEGEVYNLEVEEDNSYTAEFATVHNCWTPWFSLYGSKSGFDSIEECFGKYADKIYAVETGLSSDPAMNWRIKDLDSKTIISCSDAHSGPKLGREATVFELETLNYQAIREAIMGNQKSTTGSTSTTSTTGMKEKVLRELNARGTRDTLDSRDTSSNRIAFTIEFYPEEGKYHYTGHRLCNIRQDPAETQKLGTICPVCGKPLTVGVMHRVDQLAGRSIEELKLTRRGMYIESKAFPNRPAYVMIVPLIEIVAQSLGSPVSSRKVMEEYLKLCQLLGGEFSVLLKAGTNEIEKISGERMAEGIEKVRNGNIIIEPGYDGVFGVVKIWGNKEEKKKSVDTEKQLGLFS